MLSVTWNIALFLVVIASLFSPALLALREDSYLLALLCGDGRDALLNQCDHQGSAVFKVPQLLAFINGNRIAIGHMSELVFEYYRTNGIQANRDHCHVAVFIRLDHQIATAELLENAVVSAIAEIPGIVEGGKVLDAPILPAYVFSSRSIIPEFATKCV